MHQDTLTGLPNREAIVDRINQGLIKAEYDQSLLAVMFLNLDKFKMINDSMGYAVGDELLKTIAIRLSASLRTSDIVARTEGDEFIIALPEINEPRDAERVAKKILERVSPVVHAKGYPLEVSVSLGIALYPDDGKSVFELLKKATKAMYTAKEQGGNRFCFVSIQR